MTNSFQEKITIAGFGGQGIMLLGKLLAQTAMKNNLNVTYMPAYGAEVRGGTANCMVCLGTDPIANPMVINPDTLIVLNKASFSKFLPKLKSGGKIIVNTSKIDNAIDRDDIEVIAAPIDDIAIALDSPKSANMVALGIFLQSHSFLSPQMACDCLCDVLAKRYHSMLQVNADAILKGAQSIQ
ncbi:MAG: 2-oxoacid:acceptor oxidoreductase family protein [Phycisphaerae bacterium]|nr:2-oxoacid:acceptor oxidoreductase family protein [Phycisphaerae bacterium]